MNKTILGILLILGGVAIPLLRESLGSGDKLVMGLFLGLGALLLLSGRLLKKEEDEYYRYSLNFEELRLFDEKGRAALSVGQQLYTLPYQGLEKKDVHLMTAEGVFVAALLEEQRDAVVYKIEKHSPVLVTVKGLKPNGLESYDVQIELMC